MNAKILNRDFQHPSDGWYQIEPKGDHPNRAAKVVQVIDEDAAVQIVNRFNAEATAGTLRHGNELLIDHEHFSGDTDKESRAYGWLQQLQNRADGIYGQIRWTATGKAAVDGGDYRFFSTEYDPADLQEIKVSNGAKPVANRKVRPTRLDGLSLTNMPNNRGQRPITNRGDTTFPGARASADSNRNQQQKANSMKSVCTLLGLSAEADETSVHAAVAKLQNRITDLEPFETETTTLKNRIAQFDGEQVDTLLELHGVKEEKVKNRLKPVLVAMKNREDRVAALLDFGFKPGEAKAQPAAGRVLNRQDGKPATEEGSSGNEQELAQKAESEINTYRLTNRCSYGEARNIVRTQKPELFGITKN